MTDWKVGDRVVCTVDYPDNNRRITAGNAGTICVLRQRSDDTLVGVRWDENVGGHDCEGFCEYYYGWNVSSRMIEPEEYEPFEFDEEAFDSLLKGT